MVMCFFFFSFSLCSFLSFFSAAIPFSYGFFPPFSISDSLTDKPLRMVGISFGLMLSSIHISSFFMCLGKSSWTAAVQNSTFRSDFFLNLLESMYVMRYLPNMAGFEDSVYRNCLKSMNICMFFGSGTACQFPKMLLNMHSRTLTTMLFPACLYSWVSLTMPAATTFS